MMALPAPKLSPGVARQMQLGGFVADALYASPGRGCFALVRCARMNGIRASRFVNAADADTAVTEAMDWIMGGL